MAVVAAHKVLRWYEFFFRVYLHAPSKSPFLLPLMAHLHWRKWTRVRTRIRIQTRTQIPTPHFRIGLESASPCLHPSPSLAMQMNPKKWVEDIPVVLFAHASRKALFQPSVVCFRTTRWRTLPRLGLRCLRMKQDLRTARRGPLKLVHRLSAVSYRVCSKKHPKHVSCLSAVSYRVCKPPKHAHRLFAVSYGVCTNKFPKHGFCLSAVSNRVCAKNPPPLKNPEKNMVFAFHRIIQDMFKVQRKLSEPALVGGFSAPLGVRVFWGRFHWHPSGRSQKLVTLD